MIRSAIHKNALHSPQAITMSMSIPMVIPNRSSALIPSGFDSIYALSKL